MFLFYTEGEWNKVKLFGSSQRNLSYLKLLEIEIVPLNFRFHTLCKYELELIARHIWERPKL